MNDLIHHCTMRNGGFIPYKESRIIYEDFVFIDFESQIKNEKIYDDAKKICVSVQVCGQIVELALENFPTDGNKFYLYKIEEIKSEEEKTNVMERTWGTAKSWIYEMDRLRINKIKLKVLKIVIYINTSIAL